MPTPSALQYDPIFIPFAQLRCQPQADTKNAIFLSSALIDLSSGLQLGLLDSARRVCVAIFGQDVNKLRLMSSSIDSEIGHVCKESWRALIDEVNRDAFVLF